MYESYWQLETKPFENTSEARFYYPGEAHQGALLKLRYAIENRRGAALLTGAAGLGKTLLVQALTRQLSEPLTPIVHLVFPQMPPDQLLAYLADELTGSSTAAAPTVQQSIRRVEAALRENAAAGRHAVVVIDEAQVLRDTHALETMRLLLNFEHQSQPILTLLLVGQPVLLPTLDRMPQLDARLGVKCLLRPFTLEESISYVTHRLNAAGATQPIFEQDALETMHMLSQGVPRYINRLGDLALLIGYAEEQPIISAAQIEAVAEELVAVAPE
jgi:general secretion pathway protein A